MPRGRVATKGYRANGPTVTFRLTDAEDAQLRADAEQAGMSKHALAKQRALVANEILSDQIFTAVDYDRLHELVPSVGVPNPTE